MAKTESANNELAKAENNTEIAPVSFDDISSNNSGVINTINMDTMEGKVTTLNALNNAMSLKIAGNSVLCIKDCIIMPGTRKGRNGAPDSECSNTYLIDTDGNAFFSQSDGIARSARMIAMMFPDFGKNTKDGCLKLYVDAKELDNGNTIKNLVLDI